MYSTANFLKISRKKKLELIDVFLLVKVFKHFPAIYFKHFLAILVLRRSIDELIARAIGKFIFQ